MISFRLLTLIIILTAIGCVASNTSINYESLFSSYKDKSVSELTKMGFDLVNDNRNEEGLACFKLASEKYTETLDDRDQINGIISMTNIGYLYAFRYHNPVLAYQWLSRALDLAEKSKAEDILYITPVIYDNMARIYDDFGDRETAVHLYEKSFFLATKKSDRATINRIFNDYVSTALLHDKTDGLKKVVECFMSLPKSDSPLSTYSIELAKGLYSLVCRDFTSCDSILHNSLAYLDTDNDSSRYAVTHLLMESKINLMMREVKKSRSALDKARKTAIADSIHDLLPRIYALYAHGFGLENDSTHEKEYKIKVLEINDSLYSAQNFGKIKDLESSQRMETLHRDIKMATAVQKHRLSIIWILCGTLLAIIVMAVILLRRNKELRHSNEALVNQNRHQIEEQRLQARLRKDFEDKITTLENRIAEINGNGNNQDKSMSAAKLPLDRDDILQLVVSIKDFLDNSEDVYSPDFSMERLAEHLGCKSNYLSHVVNKEMNKNFSSLISETRIRRACELLLDPHTSRTLTLDAIAEKVGYRSRTHFSAVFKKVTGVSPSKYAGIARQGQENNTTHII